MVKDPLPNKCSAVVTLISRALLTAEGRRQNPTVVAKSSVTAASSPPKH